MDDQKKGQHHQKEVLELLVVVPRVRQGSGSREHLDYGSLQKQGQRGDHSEYGQVLLHVPKAGYKGDHSRELEVHYYLHEGKRSPEFEECRYFELLFHYFSPVALFATPLLVYL